MTATEPTDLHTVQHRGCWLSYRVRGAGPPVLFVQGVGVHGDGWTPQTDALTDRFRCLTFDNRGVGRSLPVFRQLTVEQMADDALAVLDAEGVASAHVVGHSLGGLVALALALAAPGRVRSLSLLCTFARGKDGGRPTPGMIWKGLRTRVGTRGMRRRAFLELVLPPNRMTRAERDAAAARLAPLFGHDLADHPAVEMVQLRAMRNFDATLRLGELVGMPTLVAAAAHDPIAPPAVGRRLAADVPVARYVEFADASHGLPITHAGRVNDLLADHIARAERAGG